MKHTLIKRLGLAITGLLALATAWLPAQALAQGGNDLRVNDVGALDSGGAITLSVDNSAPVVGSTVTVTINLQNAPPFACWGEYLKFDKARLELTAQSAGTFATFVSDSATLPTINARGDIRAAGFGMANNSGGNGTLGVFTFKALAAGSAIMSTEAKSATNLFGDVLMNLSGTELYPTIGGPLTINVTGGGTTNQPPTAIAQSVTTAEDTAKAITLTGSDPDGSALTYTVVSNPAHGTLSGTGASRTYTPAANYNGSDSFTFKVNDGALDSAAATVSITVTAVNDAPTVTAGGTPTSGTAPLAVNFTATGADMDGDTLTYAWTFGDSTTAATQNPSHTYAAAGTYTATVTVSDGKGGTASASVTITVTAQPNRAPVANAQSVTTAEDTAKAITLTGSDPDGSALTYTIVSNPTHGTLSGAGASRTYTPAANYNGSDSFTFKVNDGALDSAAATVSITVTAVNDGPTVTASGTPTSGTAPLAVNFTATGADVDGDTLTYAWTFGDGGTASTQNPSHTYAAAGTYTATVTVSDGKGGTASASVTITVTAQPNRAPVANAQSVTTAEDTAKAITLTGSDPDGSALTYTIVSNPTHGTLSGAGASRTYTPAANYNGSDSFTFKVNDGALDSAAATVSITVTAVNDGPTVTASGTPTSGTAPLAVNFTATGADVDGDTLSYAWTFGDGGTASTQNPSHTYAAAGTYTATVTVSDGKGGTASASVTITVSAVSNGAAITLSVDNSAPVVGSTVTVTINLQNAPPFACWGEYLKFDKARLELTAQSAGTFATFVSDSATLPTINARGDIRAAGFGMANNSGSNGTLGVFTFKALAAGSAIVSTEAKSATNAFGDVLINLSGTEFLPTIGGPLTINVTGGGTTNQPPTAIAQSVTTAEDTAKAITLAGSDPEGSNLTYTVVSNPAHGTLSGTGASRTYTPAANYNGSDSFTFKVNDGALDSAAATVSITVTAVNDAPTVTASGSPTSGTAPLAVNFTATGADVDGDALTYAWAFGDGTTAATQNPSHTYAAAGTYTATVTVSDGKGGTASASVTITVTAQANRPPVANAQSVTTAEDTAKAITLTGSDPDGSALTYTIVSNPAHGTLSGTGASRTYTPAANYNGSDSFTFKVNDGALDSAAATVSITVTAVNDGPTVTASGSPTSGTAPLAVNFTATGADVDGDALTYAWTFGDSTSAATQNPSHTYAAVGTYTATVTVSDGKGGTASASVTITVISGSNGAAITLSANNTAPAVGSTFTVTVNLQNAPPFAFWGEYLKFDKARLALTAQSAGAFTTFVPDSSDLPTINARGDIRAAGYGMANNSGGNGTLGVFTFKALAAGSAIVSTEAKSDANSYGDVLINLSGTEFLPTIGGPLTINVTGGGTTNQPPTANAQSVTTAEDTAKAITLTGSDPEGSALTYTIVSNPAHGTLSGTGASRTYTPAANYNGSDSFTFKVNDGALDSAAATVAITVTAVNDGPTVAASGSPTSGTAPLAVNFTATGADVDGDALTYAWTFGDGTTAATQNPSHTYAAAGTYTATVTVSDGKGGTASASVTITVTAQANQPPVANAQSVTTAEDTAKAITLTGSDPDGSALTYTIVSNPAHGTLSGTGASRTYTPAANYNGSDSFTFKVNDGALDSTPATVSITVTAVNDAPTVAASGTPTSGTAPLAVAFIATGSDVDGDALTYAWTFGDSTSAATQNPSHTYAAAGTYTATVTVSDGKGGTASANVAITVTAGSSGGVAVTVTNYTLNGIAYRAHIFTGTGTTNLPLDSSRSVEYLVVGGGGGGGDDSSRGWHEAGGGGGGGFTNGVVSLAAGSYAVTVGGGGVGGLSGGAGAAGGNSVFNGLTAYGGGGGGGGSAGPGSAGTGGGACGDTTQTPGIGSQGSNGGARVSWNGGAGGGAGGNGGQPPNAKGGAGKASLMAGTSVNYAGGGGGGGWDSAGTGTDGGGNGTTANTGGGNGTDGLGGGGGGNGGKGGSGIVIVRYVVSGTPNQAPVAQNQSVTTAEDTAKAIVLTGSDPEGSNLTYTVVSNPAHGTLSGTGASRTYTPAANYNGSDSFTFKVNDGALDSTPATVSITVTAVNDNPTVTASGTPTSGTAPLAVAFTATGADVDGDTLTYAWTFGDGTTAATQNPSHTYAAAGTYTATVTVSDGKGGTASASVTITVTAPANQPPTANAQSVTTAEDTAKAITLTGSDPDGSALTYTIVSNPAHGTLSGTGASRTYTPAANYNGSDSFTFKVNDGALDSTPATVSITVTAVNDNPTVTASGTPTSGTAPLAVAFTATGADVDGDTLTYAWTFGDGTTAATQNPSHTYVAAGTYTATVTVSDGKGGTASANVTITVTPAVTGWVEPFEAYAVGSQLHGQGGWKGWDNDAAAGALVAGTPVRGGAKSAAIVGDSDLVHQYSGATAGLWIYTAWQYVPTNFAGTQAFVMLNTYQDGGAKSWSVQIGFSGASGKVHSYSDGAELPLVKGRWVELRVEIDLTADVQRFYYDGQKLYEKSWTSGLSTGGARNIAAVDLFANGASAVYYDDMSLLPGTSANQPPVANAQSVTTAEGTAKAITLTGSDPEGSNLTYTVVSNPAHGTLSGTGASRTYTPAANYNGSDSFTFKVNDGTLDSAVATVSITVTAGSGGAAITLSVDNSAPVVGSTVTVTINLQNAPPFACWGEYLKFDKARLELTAQSAGTFSTFVSDSASLPTINARGDIHAAGFGMANNSGGNGTLGVFTFKALAVGSAIVSTEAKSATNLFGDVLMTLSGAEIYPTIGGPLTIAVTSGGGNRPPVANAQSVTTAEDTAKAITLAATDADGDALTYVIVANPAHGTLSGTAPNVTYTPAANYSGSDAFTFRASDGKTNSNVATVSITVTSVNDAPVAMAGVDPVVGSITDEFYFWAMDSYDVDGTITGREWQINGTLVTTNAEFLYTFAAGGAYTVTLTVWDNAGASGSDSVEVNVSEPSTPVVSVSVFDGVAGEPGLASGSGRFQVSRIGDLTTAITVNYAMSGTASNGVDYTLVSGMVTLGAGEVSRTVVVDPLADALVEGTEWAILSLADGPGYVVDEELAAGAVMIQDQTYGTPTVTAVAMDAIATEPGLTTDKGSIKISRTGSCNAALTVLVAVSGTAVNGVDYSTVTVPVVLAAGQNAKTLSIVPLADGVVESNETVTLTIQANAAYVIGAGQAAATVTIQDNTQLATPTVSVVATDPNAAEPGAFVNTGTFTFRRTSRFHETLVMNCTIGGTASNGTDYNTVSGAVTFPAGVATKTLTIIPKADGITEGPEAVVMTIQSSAAYAIEAGKSAATVTITE